MRKKEIVQMIRDYVNDDKAKYAVLIDGAWGCGKTYLYQNILREEISHLEYGRNDRKGNVYISLYGISTIEELAKELINNYLLKVKFHGSKKKEKIYENVSKFMGIASKAFSFSVYGQSIDLEKGMNGIINNISFENMVICFDDLERCSIPINNLFGMINTLVEHCNCKVIILANENNIGKLYANTNVEEKYLTILMGRKLHIKKTDEQYQNENENCEMISDEELKKMSEMIYSENYIYKDIKEKVIGLSLKYTPNLNEEFESIIGNIVNDKIFVNMLIDRKDDILEYMEKCRNCNIRIMGIWLRNFERIFKVIYKNFGQDKYFHEIFNKLTIYTIRVACAMGKNQKLAEWEKGIEIGYISLEDDFVLEKQGYKFVDDLYRDSLFDEIRINQVARIILNEEKDYKEKEREFLKDTTYKELCHWHYLEEKEIVEKLSNLLHEIRNNEYSPQIYQQIISVLISLKQEGYCDDNLLMEVCEAMKQNVKKGEIKINIENYQHFSKNDVEELELYHTYYDPVYISIVKKNVETDMQKMKLIDCSNGNNFLNYCFENANIFPDKKSFIYYINLSELKNICYAGDIKEIYDISSVFLKIYDVNEGYKNYYVDMEQLNQFKNELENIQCNSNTRRKAIEILINILNIIIKNMEEFYK